MEKLLQELEKRPDLKRQAGGSDRNPSRVADPNELAVICVAGICFWDPGPHGPSMDQHSTEL
jgi:hypothetical protein